MKDEPKLYWLFRWRRAVVAGCLIATAVCALGMLRLQQDHSVEAWFVDGDPTTESYHRLHELFGGDEYVSIAFEDDDPNGVFNNRSLEAIAALTREVASLKGVSRVFSLTNIERIDSRDDELLVEPYVRALPMSAAGLEKLRRDVLADEWARNLVVSADGRVAAVVLEVAYLGRDFPTKHHLVEQLEPLAARILPFPPRISGQTVIDRALAVVALHDAMRVMPIAFLVVGFILWILFRHPFGILAPLITVSLAIVMLVGIMGAAGVHLTLLTMSLPVLLMVTCLEDSVHVLASYQRRLAGRAPDDATVADVLAASVKHIWFPCLMTSVTTLFGFYALTTSRLAVVREFAVLASIGCIVEYVVAFTFLPALLAIVKPVLPPPEQLSWVPTGGGLVRAWEVVAGRRPKTILALHVLVFAVGMALAWNLPVESNVIKYFAPDTTVRRDTEWLDDKMGGVVSIEVLVESPSADSPVDRIAVLRGLDAVERQLRAEPGVTYTMSLAGLVKRLNAGFDPGAGERLPATDAGVQQLLLLYDGNDLERLLAPSRQATRLHARVRQSWSPDFAALLDRLRATLARELPGQATSVTGTLVMQRNMEREFLVSAATGGMLAALLVTICMILACRSIRFGLAAMIPNILPIATIPAVMAIAGIPIDFGTALTLSLCLGVLVDDTIHMASSYVAAWQRGLDTDACVRASMSESGREVTLNSIILACGFATLMLSSFQPNFYMGFLMAATVLMAAEADLVLVPTVLALVPRRRQPAPLAADAEPAVVSSAIEGREP